jgi:hypothetical protein
MALYVVLVASGQAMWFGAKPGTRQGTLTLTRVHSAFANAVNR